MAIKTLICHSCVATGNHGRVAFAADRLGWYWFIAVLPLRVALAAIGVQPRRIFPAGLRRLGWLRVAIEAIREAGCRQVRIGMA